MLSRILSSLNYRKNLANYGIYYLVKKDFNIFNIRVRNKRINVACPESEKSVLGYELYSILIDDCYGLASLRGKISSVLDIGANIGLFTIAASYYFPQAIVHSYEPNSEIETFLNQNCSFVGAKYFLEGVALKNYFASLLKGKNSLHSTLSIEAGTIPCTAYSQAIQRLGNRVDLVKLDCEGAEWELFKDIEAWSKVKYLTMEYHLWVDPGYSFNDLLECLEKIGFVCTYHKPSPSGKWGLIQAHNKALIQ